MVTRKQIEIRYHSLLSQRLYYLRKLKEAKSDTKYNVLIVKLNNVENILKMFEWMLKEQEK